MYEVEFECIQCLIKALKSCEHLCFFKKNHASSVSLGKSNTLPLIAMKFGMVIHGAQRINHTDFDYPDLKSRSISLDNYLMDYQEIWHKHSRSPQNDS